MNTEVSLAVVKMLNKANCIGEHCFNMDKTKQPNQNVDDVNTLEPCLCIKRHPDGPGKKAVRSCAGRLRAFVLCYFPFHYYFVLLFHFISISIFYFNC